MNEMETYFQDEMAKKEIAESGEGEEAATQLKTQALMLYVDFSLPVQNNNPVMVNKKFNAKEINPSLSDEIIYGYYTIHIERRGAAPKAPVASH